MDVILILANKVKKVLCQLYLNKKKKEKKVCVSWKKNKLLSFGEITVHQMANKVTQPYPEDTKMTKTHSPSPSPIHHLSGSSNLGNSFITKVHIPKIELEFKI